MGHILQLLPEMQKAASVASMLVLIFFTSCANLRAVHVQNSGWSYSTGYGLYIWHSCANFYLWTAVPIFGQCKHIISTASVAGTDVVCIISTAVLIFGQCKHKISTALSLFNLITLFCRNFEKCWIYAFFVLIFGARKCACAIFYAFCMSANPIC